MLQCLSAAVREMQGAGSPKVWTLGDLHEWRWPVCFPGYTSISTLFFVLIILHSLYLDYGRARSPPPNGRLGGGDPLPLPFFPNISTLPLNLGIHERQVCRE